MALHAPFLDHNLYHIVFCQFFFTFYDTQYSSHVGFGKIALCQSIFNTNKVKKYSEAQIWLYISYDFVFNGY